MAKRGWSLTDAQLTNLRESWGEHKRRQKLNPAARSAQAPTPRKSIFDGGMPTGPAVPSRPSQRPSPDRLRERTRSRYNEETYSQPDISSLGLGETKSGYPTPTPARKIAVDPSWRPGTGDFDNPNIPKRRMVIGGGTGESSKQRRQASTESAFRSADASMFNSTVTPKAKRVEDKKPLSHMSPDQNVFW